MLLKYLFSYFSLFTFRFGGDGGGSTGVYYENQDKLFGQQADIAQGLYNEYVNNGAPMLQGLADQARQGVDAEKYAGLANVDAQNAIANSQAQTIRQAQSLGLNPASGNFAEAMADQQYNNTALLAGSQNRARQQAENLDWARRTDVANMYRGAPGQAAAGLGAAAQGYGGMANAANTNSMLNAQGYGQFGAALAKGFFKDGGEVKKAGLHMASGGITPLPDWRTRPSSVKRTGGGSNGLEQVIAGAAPTVIGKLAAPYVKAAASTVKDGLSSVLTPTAPAAAPATAATTSPVTESLVTEVPSDMGITGSSVAPAAEAAPVVAEATPVVAEGTSAALTGVGTAALADGTATSAGTGALVAGAGTAAADSALAYASLATATEVPWWVALAALKNGGPVRKDMRPGGKVAGPGGPKDDKIPAWLSDGEFVVNAKAVQMVGKDKLNAINNAGLKARGDKPLPLGLSHAPNAHAGMGGAFGGNLGVALGAGVNQYERMVADDRNNMLAKAQTDALAARTKALDAQSAESDQTRPSRVAATIGQNNLSLAQADANTGLIPQQTQVAKTSLEAAGNKATADAALSGGALERLPGRMQHAAVQGVLDRQGQSDMVLGTMGQLLARNDKAGAIRFANAIGKQGDVLPETNGMSITDIVPVEGGKGKDYPENSFVFTMEDGRKGAVSASVFQGAMDKLRTGKYHFLHTNDGSVYSGNENTGSVSQVHKGDPNKIIGQHDPAAIAESKWVLANKDNPDAMAAYTKVKSTKAGRTEFVKELLSKNAMPNETDVELSKRSDMYGRLYDALDAKKQVGISRPAAQTENAPAKLDPRINSIIGIQ